MRKILHKALLVIEYPKVFVLLITVNFITIVIIFAIQNNLPPVVPLYYGKPKGEEQLAPSILLAFPAFAALSITFLNIILIKFLKDDFLKKVLLGLAITATVLSLVTIIKIVLLVGSF